MYKTSNYYKKSEDIGNHENVYYKIGDYNSGLLRYRVTFVSSDSATVIYNDKEFSLVEGMILGANAIVRSNDSLVEIKTQQDDIFRLSTESEFCLEDTIEGINAVYYGNVFYAPSNHSTIKCSHKYRTSCWVDCENKIATEVVSENKDVYYSFDDGLQIYEYDEMGNKFVIVDLLPFQKCILKFNLKEDIRNRYTVIQLKDMTAQELERMYLDYVSPMRWNCKYKFSLLTNERSV